MRWRLIGGIALLLIVLLFPVWKGAIFTMNEASRDKMDVKAMADTTDHVPATNATATKATTTVSSKKSPFPDLDGLGLKFHGSLMEPAMPAPDFNLIDQHGNPFRLSDQRGNVVVLFFGYTTCPDVCPTTLVHFREVKRSLGPDAERARFVFVTVDPERDNPEKLAIYITRFDPSFYGLTGSDEQLQTVWDAYDIHVERVDMPESAIGHTVDHTSLSFVIDADGHLIGLYPFGIPSEYVTKDLQRLLQPTGGDIGADNTGG